MPTNILHIHAPNYLCNNQVHTTYNPLTPAQHSGVCLYASARCYRVSFMPQHGALCFLRKQDAHVMQHALGPAGHDCSSSEPPAWTKATVTNGHALQGSRVSLVVLPPSALLTLNRRIGHACKCHGRGVSCTRSASGTRHGSNVTCSTNNRDATRQSLPVPRRHMEARRYAACGHAFTHDPTQQSTAILPAHAF